MNPPDESVPTDTETSGAVVHRMTAEEELATALGFARIATEFLLDGDHPNPGTPNGYPPLRTYLLPRALHEAGLPAVLLCRCSRGWLR